MLTTEKEQAAENFEPKRDGHFDKRVGYYVGEEDNLIKSVEQIYYHLQYRNTNPQTLELFLVGLESGKKLHIMD